MMKEEIIVIPSTNKLSLSLAYQGKNLFNTRFFTPIELTREVLLRNGKVCSKEFVSREEELVYYKSIIENIEYFKTTKLADIKNINQTINTIRKLVIQNEEQEIQRKLSTGVFKEKNEALYKLYKTYINKLTSENKIDTIGLIRYAIDCNIKIDTKAKILKEYQLQPLEEELVRSTCKYEESSLFNLYEVTSKDISIESFKSCYGSSNEVLSIIDDIYINNNADECVVACADYPTYSQIFYDYATKYNIDISFGNGLSLINSYPGKLLEQYYAWSTLGNFGWEPFNKLIYSPYFNFELFNSLIFNDKKEENNVSKFYERASKLRLTNSLETNDSRINDFINSIKRKDINDNDELEKYIDGFKIISNELSLPIEEFIEKYYVTRNDNEFVVKLDNSAKDTLVNEIKIIKNIGLDISGDVIETLLRKPVLRQANMPGHIHVTSIEGALSSLRKNLYICGLSSSNYPGSPKENPLLLDCDLELFENDNLTSNGKIKSKIDLLKNLVNLASGLNNKIYLSYPGLNVSELKNNNASSLLFELYKQNNKDKTLDDFKNTIINVGYFDPSFLKTSKIGEAYNKSKEIVYRALALNNQNKVSLDIGKYSPSALNTFFNCKKQFLYQNLLKLNAPDDYDPYEVIPASEQGTLAHSLMEYLGKHKEMSKDDFVKLAQDVFDEYTKITVPLISEKIIDVREQFVDMLANGWQMDKDNPRKLAMAEEDKDALHAQTGIVVHGYPDRVELDENGNAVIIDFKTERDKDAHIQDDIKTCLQVIIYAYIVENTLGIKVDHCEYRMLRFEDGIITCKYDDEIKQQLNEKLHEFKNALENKDFTIEPFDKETEKVKCKYCKFQTICGKVVNDEQ